MLSTRRFAFLLAIIISISLTSAPLPAAAAQENASQRPTLSIDIVSKLADVLRAFDALLTNQRTTPVPEYVAAGGSGAGVGRIDQLTSTAIRTPAITGGTISGASVSGYLPLSGGSLSGPLSGTDLTLSGVLTAGALSVSGVSSGGAIFAPFFSATSSTATSTFAGGLTAANGAFNVFQNGNVGIGTTSPWGLLSVQAPDNSSAPQLVVGSSTAASLFVGANGNVGIGTTTPLYPLSVSGQTRLYGVTTVDYSNQTQLSYPFAGTPSGQLMIWNQHESAPADGTFGGIMFSAMNSTGFNQIGYLGAVSVAGGSNRTPDIVLGSRLGGGSVERIRITGASGNVGIGTSSPGSLLSLNGIANFSSATSTFYSGVQTTALNITTATSTFANGLVINAGCIYINGACLNTSGITNYWTSGGGNIYNNTGTKVGIGTTTPWASFSVSVPNNSAANQLVIASSTAVSLLVTSTGNVGIGTTTPWGLLSVQAPNNSSAPQFVVGSSTATSLIVASNGNVGIGTSSPTSILDIESTGWIDQLVRFNTGKVSQLQIEGQTYAVMEFMSRNGDNRLKFLSDNYGGGGYIQSGTYNNNGNKPLTFSGWFGNLGSALHFRFANSSIGSGNDATSTLDVFGNMSVGSYAGVTPAPTNGIIVSGNVGIGTSSPTAQLHTTGTVRFSNFGAGTLTTDASGNLSVSSDERLKNVDGAFTRGLADIVKLSPILYHWNATSGLDTTNQYAGFSAQNVQGAIPEAVGQDSHGFLTLQDRPLLAAVVNSIKDLAQTISGFADSFTSKRVIASQELCVGSTCVTEEQLKALLAAAGQQPSATLPATSSTTSGAGTSSNPVLAGPPVIQLNGNNPAIVAVGSAYADLGATITGPQQDINLGIVTFLNGVKVADIQLDTSTSATSTIDYVVTDQFGTAATTTRTVVVQ